MNLKASATVLPPGYLQCLGAKARLKEGELGAEDTRAVEFRVIEGLSYLSRSLEVGFLEEVATGLGLVKTLWKISDWMLLFCFLFALCGSGDQIQGQAHTRQALYH